VELVQIPVPDETNDNIVAYWVPDQAPPLKEPYDFEYQLLWQKNAEMRPPQAWVTQTRRGRGYARKPDDSVSFVIDWEGPALKQLGEDPKVETVISSDGNGRLLETNGWRNEVTGGWRTTVRMRRVDEAKPVELRAFLRHGGNAISETWSYVLPSQ
jgi:glucans biosynthesis protein